MGHTDVGGGKPPEGGEPQLATLSCRLLRNCVRTLEVNLVREKILKSPKPPKTSNREHAEGWNGRCRGLESSRFFGFYGVGFLCVGFVCCLFLLFFYGFWGSWRLGLFEGWYGRRWSYMYTIVLFLSLSLSISRSLSLSLSLSSSAENQKQNKINKQIKRQHKKPPPSPPKKRNETPKTPNPEHPKPTNGRGQKVGMGGDCPMCIVYVYI